MRRSALVFIASFLMAVTAAPAGATPGDVLWDETTGGAAEDWGAAVALTPDGGTVISVGSIWSNATEYDARVTAYDASDGSELWSDTYNGAGGEDDWLIDVELIDGGTRALVVGSSRGLNTGQDGLLILYDVTSGNRVWVKRFTGVKANTDIVETMAVDSKRVYIGGWGAKLGGYVAAYDLATGRALWRWVRGETWVFDVAARGGKVAYASQDDANGGTMYGGVLTAKAGRSLWAKGTKGTDPAGNPIAKVVAFTPDAATVLLGGSVYQESTDSDAALVAYASGTGKRRWRQVTDAGEFDNTEDLLVSEDGATVYEAIYTSSSQQSFGVARSVADGTAAWTSDPSGEYEPRWALGEGELFLTTSKWIGIHFDRIDLLTGDPLGSFAYNGNAKYYEGPPAVGDEVLFVSTRLDDEMGTLALSLA